MLAVLGATGYTGGLVCERARALGIPLRLVGRRADALARVARPGEEIRDRRRARPRTRSRAPSTAPRWSPRRRGRSSRSERRRSRRRSRRARTGSTRAASRRSPAVVYERFGPEAERAGVVALTSFGFDYVPGDLAAQPRGRRPRAARRDRRSATRSTASSRPRARCRTAAELLGRPQVSYVDGRLEPSRFGSTTRRLRFPFGERTVVEWFGTEPLTVPRHTQVGTVRTFVRAPGIAARAARLAPLAAPLLRGAAALGRGPSGRLRQRSRFAVVAEARGPAGARRATVTGRDVYELTGLLLATAADALLARGGARGRRARAGGGVRRADARRAARAAAGDRRDRRPVTSGGPPTLRSCAGSGDSPRRNAMPAATGRSTTPSA